MAIGEGQFTVGRDDGGNDGPGPGGRPVSDKFAVALKQFDDMRLASIQKRATREPEEGGLSVVLWMTQQADIIAPWWSKSRDADLRVFLGRCDLMLGAFYAISAKLSALPFRIEPRDPSVKSHWKQAEQFEIRLYEGSEFGAGWEEFFTRWSMDRWNQDNGGFAEVIGAGSKTGPIRGPALGLANLDSWRCTRTGSAEYPVIYDDIDGKRYKLHHTRVMYSSQLPSPDAEMFGVGRCWTTRCLQVNKAIYDVLRYKQEKLGSRPTRGFLFTPGVNADHIAAAVQVAAEQADAVGLQRFGKIPVVAPKRADASAQLLDLASLPDGFDYRTEITIAMYVIALAGGFPPRWIWPATTVGATKADAMYQHLAGSMSGPALELRAIQQLLAGSPKGRVHAAGKFLPPHLKMTFDLQDDERDMMAADIAAKRATARGKDLEQGVVTIRVAREKMKEEGEISDAQFIQLEAEDGRLEDGSDAASLIYTDNPYVQGLDPLNLNLEDLEAREWAAKEALATASAGGVKSQAVQALACIGSLKASLHERQPPPPQEAEEAEMEGEEEEEGEKAWKQRTLSTRHPKRNRDAVTAYEAELRRIYDDWAVEAGAQLERAEDADERERMLAGLLLLLGTRLKVAGRRGLTEAFELGLQGEVPTEEARAALDKAIADNDYFIDNKLIPDAKDRFMQDAATPGFEWRGETLLAALSALAWRTRAYGGAFWATIALGVGVGVMRRGNPVRRFLDPDPRVDHCATCPAKEAEYDSWEDMVAICDGVPGDGSDECGPGCKCGVDELVAGDWRPRL